MAHKIIQHCLLPQNCASIAVYLLRLRVCNNSKFLNEKVNDIRVSDRVTVVDIRFNDLSANIRLPIVQQSLTDSCITYSRLLC